MDGFSVLIPVYINDNEEHLEVAIRSCIDQTLRPNEIVITVDGPIKDEARDVLEKLSNEYEGLLNIHYFEQNRGLGVVLAEGVTLCKYDVIARMDADDISVKDRFFKQYNELTSKNLDIVGSNIVEFYGDEIETSIREVPKSADIEKYAKKRCPFNHMTVMFKKDAVLKAGNYKDMRSFEDYYLWVRMIKNNAKMDNMEECLVKARTDSMFDRRGGKNYVLYEKNFMNELVNIGFINEREKNLNLTLKKIVRLAPTNARKYIYKTFLRKGVQWKSI